MLLSQSSWQPVPLSVSTIIFPAWNRMAQKKDSGTVSSLLFFIHCLLIKDDHCRRAMTSFPCASFFCFDTIPRGREREKRREGGGGGGGGEGKFRNGKTLAESVLNSEPLSACRKTGRPTVPRFGCTRTRPAIR